MASGLPRVPSLKEARCTLLLAEGRSKQRRYIAPRT
jgi:hypothetical protein